MGDIPEVWVMFREARENVFRVNVSRPENILSQQSFTWRLGKKPVLKFIEDENEDDELDLCETLNNSTKKSKSKKSKK